MELESKDDLAPMDDFERDLHAAMQRKPASAGLKRKVMERRAKARAIRRHQRVVWWERLAASIVLVGVVSGAFTWRSMEQRRKGEEAKQQVFTALRITSRALQQMNEQLTQQNKNGE